jgi:hypothetical protein
MTSLTDTQVVTASGGLVELGYAENDANLSITATTGAGMDNISPELTVVCDGSPIMVEFFCAGARATTSGSGTTDALWFALKVDGSVEEERLGVVGNVASGYGSLTPIKLSHRMTPSAGSHTFRVGGWVSNAARSGYIGGGSPYPPAWIRVSKIVEATQWPAVTTGTIICTSSTRPASPFEGQMIYETDTGLTRYYDGTAWEDTAAATRPRHAEVYLASNISYPRATLLEWTHLREDNTGGAWAASPNPERLVFPADGMYLCVANMRWDVGSGNDSSQTSMSVVGGLGTVSNVGYAVNGTSVSEILTTVAVVSAGDYLVVSCYNKPSGGSPFTGLAGSFMSFTQLSAVPT